MEPGVMASPAGAAPAAASGGEAAPVEEAAGTSSSAESDGGSPMKRKAAKTSDLRCVKCGSSFASVNAKNAHMRAHKESKCDVCGKVFAGGSYVFHSATAHGATYECAMCSHRDGDPNKLLAHILSHQEMAKVADRVFAHFRKV